MNEPDRYQELAQLWLEKAHDDLRWAEDSLEDGHGRRWTRHYEGVCFLSQQIAEKSFKAYLFHQKQKLIRTHSLERLLEHCLKLDSEFDKFKENVVVLANYYIDTRYPNISEITQFDNKNLAREALDSAKEAWNFVNQNLN